MVPLPTTNGRIVALLILLFIWTPKSVQAQAPDSIADSTFMLFSDEFEDVAFTAFSDINDFYTVGQYDTWNGKRGTIVYTKKDQDNGIVEFLKLSDFYPLEQAWVPNPFAWTPHPPEAYPPVRLNFLTSTSAPSDQGQYSRFERFLSFAPESLARKVVRVVTQSGDRYFLDNFNDWPNKPSEYLITFLTATNYNVVRTNGTLLHSGTYTYFKPNAPTGVCIFTNQYKAIGVFAFSSPTGGKGLIGTHSRDHIQFTLTDCTYKLSRNHSFLARDGGTSSVTITSIAACPWNASTTNDWIQITSGSSGGGNGTVQFSVAPNNTPEPRNGFLRISGKTFVVAQRGDLVRTNIAGKTLRLTFETGYDGASTAGIFITAPQGVDFRFVPRTTNLTHSTGTYNFSKISATNALLSSDYLQARLDYTNPSSGTFTGTNELGTATTGHFVLSATAPDFNGDAYADLVFQNTSAVLASWFMEGTSFLQSSLLRDGIPLGSNQRAFALADFNHDGQTDIVLRNTEGRLSLWLMSGTDRLEAIVLRNGITAPPWRAFSATSLRGDGKNDILFQHLDGRLATWHFDQTNFIGGTILRGGAPIGAAWRAVGAGDFNGDLQSDILLQHTSGKVAVGWMNAGEYIGAEILRAGWVPPAGLRVVGVCDINGDGRPDILWQNSRNQLAVWIMNGKEFGSAMYLRNGRPVGFQWNVIGPK